MSTTAALTTSASPSPSTSADVVGVGEVRDPTECSRIALTICGILGEDLRVMEAEGWLATVLSGMMLIAAISACVGYADGIKTAP